MNGVTWSAIVSAFLASAVVSEALSRYRGRWALLDRPNERSLHAVVTPRSGGLGILAGLAAGVAVAGQALGSPDVAWGVAAFLLVALVSFADDIWRLPAGLRFLVQLAAAGLLIYAAGLAPVALGLLPGLSLMSPAWLIPLLCVLFVVWMVNLYNFMDGMDGFAGGMAVIGFATLAVLGLLAGSPAYALANALVAVAAAGFLPFNFPPARLFMGDVGAGSLGFLAASLLLVAEREGLFPLWIGLLAFSPFVMDATWTVVRRALQGKRPWQAHREHFYQRLVGMGWSHRRTVLWAYVLMLKCSLIALACFCFTAIEVQGGLLGLAAVVYLTLIAYVNALERRQPSH
jgi:UDP-N-acetylmuramyl pentapeptide phosphotransferase/UDP-N-acetylglucosamine-1-phosphate transferase